MAFYRQDSLADSVGGILPFTVNAPRQGGFASGLGTIDVQPPPPVEMFGGWNSPVVQALIHAGLLGLSGGPTSTPQSALSGISKSLLGGMDVLNSTKAQAEGARSAKYNADLARAMKSEELARQEQATGVGAGKSFVDQGMPRTGGKLFERYLGFDPNYGEQSIFLTRDAAKEAAQQRVAETKPFDPTSANKLMAQALVRMLQPALAKDVNWTGRNGELIKGVVPLDALVTKFAGDRPNLPGAYKDLESADAVRIIHSDAAAELADDIKNGRTPKPTDVYIYNARKRHAANPTPEGEPAPGSATAAPETQLEGIVNRFDKFKSKE